jgi:hypothetical protein
VGCAYDACEACECNVRLCENRHSAQVPKGTQSQNPLILRGPATSLRFAQDDIGVITWSDVECYISNMKCGA